MNASDNEERDGAVTRSTEAPRVQGVEGLAGARGGWVGVSLLTKREEGEPQEQRSWGWAEARWSVHRGLQGQELPQEEALAGSRWSRSFLGPPIFRHTTDYEIPK